MSGLSIVVVTWNSAGEIGPLLESIRTHLEDEHEVVVVDNASTDATADIVGASPGPVRLIENRGNVGFGAANNQGVRAARHDAVVLLNPDTLLVDGSLATLAARAVRERALCGPRLLNADGTLQPSASALPGRWEDTLRLVLPAALMPKPLARRCEPWRSERDAEVGWLTGACLAAPRDILLELGPFDERIHLYSEDLDLGLRARKTGVRSLFLPTAARVVHLADRSSSQAFPDAGAGASARNRHRAVARHHGRARAAYDLAVQQAHHRVRLAAKAALRRDTSRERAWLRALRTVRRLES
ncbi:MAG TPA: glycosyltransferase family 2 protein [Solirubrobacteraceae bacterium]|nr:glycosyltransferase family 2 protein [Solirubrobacteraceae bacterium]